MYKTSLVPYKINNSSLKIYSNDEEKMKAKFKISR